MQKEIIEGFPLSSQQKHLWLVQKKEQINPYRTWYAISVHGKLDVPVLKAALKQTVAQHEILRTVFRLVEGSDIPLQVILDAGHLLAWQEYDYSDLLPTAQENKLAALLQEMQQIPFDLEQGPLLSATIVSLGSVVWHLFLCLPAFAADAVSLKNLLETISQQYGTFVSTTPLLSDEPLQYADFAQWQNDLLLAEDFALERDYWQEKKQALHLTWKLPFERNSNEDSSRQENSFSPHVITETIGAELLQKIDAAATQAGVSTLTFLLTCWYIVLRRAVGQSNLTIGVNYENRPAEELKNGLGLYAKYLPLISEKKEPDSFVKLLQHIHTALEEMQRLQEYFGWDYLRSSWQETNDEPVFPAVFDWEDTIYSMMAANISFTPYDYNACVDRFRVRLSCIPSGSILHTRFYYDATICTAEDIKVLADQYYTLIHSALHDINRPIDLLSTLSEKQYQQQVVYWNATKADLPKDQWIHQLFEDQVRYAPERVALLMEDHYLTYGALNARANQLAHYLLLHSRGQEKRVGLCIERSIYQVVGILAILKAGNTYVPLDPATPYERLQFMLEDAEIDLIITTEQLQTLFANFKQELQILDFQSTPISQQSDENPAISSIGNHLAYIMFTSGSTGRPKGVAVTHANLINYLYGIITSLNLPLGASYAALSTFAADLSNTAIFPALCTGGCLHLFPQEYDTDPARLMSSLERQPLDCLKIVPSHLLALLIASRPDLLLPRQLLVLGGETVRWDVVTKVHALAPQCRILNHYGPTETTVGVLTYQVEWQRLYSSASVSMGRPLANTEIYILNSDFQPVSIWEQGEVYIGGAGLARGYLGRPELTAERFVPNPFSQQPGARLYRTGDLARYQADGTVEFLGRQDLQVKIRGFRIELGEIEAVLRTHPQIHDAVVVARQEQESTPRLVAYLVPASEQPTSTQLRQFLQRRLPEHMLPSAFVLLDRLPLKTNGKVDRDVLPAPQSTRLDLEQNYVAAQTLIEQRLVEIWQQVLHVEQVGIRDNFFTLGGDSILSIQVVTRARQAGLLLTPRQIFQHPTIAQLAALCEPSSAITEPLAEQGVLQGEVPLTPIQHWFLAQEQPHPDHANQAVQLQPRQPVQPAALAQALSALLQQHDGLRLRFRHTAQGYQQHMVGFAEQPSLLQVDLRGLPPSLEPGILIEATRQIQASLHLQEGPLMRAVLFERAGKEGQRLLLVIHHLAVDAVSWRILLEDLEQAYQQALLGQPLRLPAKTSSYRHWAERLLDFAQQPAISQQVAYWSQQGQEPASFLPFDGPRKPEAAVNTWAEMSNVQTSLSEQQTRALLQQVPQAYHTQIQEVLLAALLLAWTQQTGQRSLRLDLEGHGRQEEEELGVDLSRTVGWFTTLYPVVLRLENSQQPGEVLKQVKEQLRQIPLHGLGYGLLRYLSADLTVQEQLASSSPAHVRFNYLGQSDHIRDESAEFTPASESSGPIQHTQNLRAYLLDIVAQVGQGQLQVIWSYSRQLHRQTTIEALAQQYIAQLQHLIAHCQSPDVGGYTPSDFPLAQLSQNKLDAISHLITQIDEGRL